MGQAYIISSTGYCVDPEIIPSRSVIAYELRRAVVAVVPDHGGQRGNELNPEVRVMEMHAIAEQMLRELVAATAQGKRLNFGQLCVGALRDVNRSRCRSALLSLIRRGRVRMRGVRRAATYEVVDANG